MLNHYPAWKNILVLLVVAFAALLALPNIYGEDPAVQVAYQFGGSLDGAAETRVEDALRTAAVEFTTVEATETGVLVRFANTESQLRAVDVLKPVLGNDYTVALNLAARTPEWVQTIGLRPMNLGLDLRGGVHFLLEVDMDAALTQAMERYESDFRTLFRQEGIRYRSVSRGNRSIAVVFRDAEGVEDGRREIRDEYPELDIDDGSEPLSLVASMSDTRVRELQNFAIQQNTTTLRNRVNELGVSEPIVQRQGQDRIVVQLPGVQDTARAKEILGATATLEFRLVDDVNDPLEAQRTGRAPFGARLYDRRDSQFPVLLKREVIVTGDQLTDAARGVDENGQPAVVVRLDAQGARRMGDTTKNNLNKPMAVVFIETKTETRYVNGEEIKTKRKVEEVISVATIRGVFSSRFQITGLQAAEAQNLALLLRAGALAAPVDIVEERTIGPSLGQDNINKGFQAVMIGFLGVVVFMILYYRAFGIVANLALIVNLTMMVALLSLFQATLTLPGIAGIVLTVGMAVDANVLIFERIREELRNGNTPQASIHAGYEKAFSTIADANITTLIAAIVLFSFGTGPIKGFAITLSIGIITSMFTAIIGTRSLVNAVYGGRRVERLAI
ncbi:MAG: protein translocase subunit SecD [Gammaproteobacteria bacterium]|nr:protein translocase subunit SecD [Gammaproteobacteria bacterium]